MKQTKVALQGSTTVSLTLGEGTTENVFMIRSGYSSLILIYDKLGIKNRVKGKKYSKQGIHSKVFILPQDKNFDEKFLR